MFITLVLRTHFFNIQSLGILFNQMENSIVFKILLMKMNKVVQMMILNKNNRNKLCLNRKFKKNLESKEYQRNIYSQKNKSKKKRSLI